MKKTISVLLSTFCLTAVAQSPYLNNTIVNTSDLFGTSRFVAMGGAMGALGADISVMSSNPAGLGVFSKNEASLTAGASWLSENTASEYSGSTFGQFNQIGAVAVFKLGGKVRNVNLGFNYQKKADYNHSFFGETLTAASWADQLNGLAQEVYDNPNDFYGNPDTYNHTLYALADLYGLFPDNIVKYKDDPNSTLGVTRGSLNAYEFNVSMNIENRFFLGLTVGLDDVDFRRGTDYWEQRTDADGMIQDFGYVNEQVITGNGFNIKLGAIVRPFESGSFRLGFTVETPTWYNLKYIDDQSLATKYVWNEKEKMLEYDHTPNSYHTYNVYDLSDSYINFLEYKLTTPWKVRAQMGSTVSTCFAWGAEYEFANYSGTSMKYPDAYGGTRTDEGFNAETENNLVPQHSVRAGVEFKPISSLALRAGYNYITSTTTPTSSWDPYFSTTALAYPTGLDYMNLSDTHIATFGLGYRHKWFYADLAYKYRHQTGDYYAFNSFYSNVPMDPIPVDLSKHSITATVGVRF